MIDALQAGGRHALKHWKIAAIIFGLQFICAAIVGAIFQQNLTAQLGNSLAGKVFEEGFNYTVFYDMLREAPDALSGFWSAFSIVIPVFALISVFLHAGAIKALLTRNTRLGKFLSHAKSYFLPFAVMAILFFVLFVIVTAVLWGPLLVNALPMVESLESDLFYVWIVIACLILYLFIISFIVNWSINSRINYAVISESVWSSLKAGFSWTRKKYLPLWLTFMFFVILSIFIMYINVRLDGINAIWITFILALILAFFRTISRLWYFSTLSFYSSAISKNETAV